MARAKQTKSRAYHHGDLRAALLGAALKLVGQSGHSSLSLRAIAREAGVSTAAPYRHFASKDELLAAVGEEGFRLLGDEIRSAMAEHTDPMHRLRESGVGYVRFAVRNPAHYSVMFERGPVEPAAHPAFAHMARESFELLLNAIADCQDNNMISVEDPRRMALLAWSGMHGIASLYNLGHVPGTNLEDVAALARQIGDALIAGIRTGD